MIKEIHNGAMKIANAMPASPRPADFVSRRTKITSIHEHAKKCHHIHAFLFLV